MAAPTPLLMPRRKPALVQAAAQAALPVRLAWTSTTGDQPLTPAPAQTLDLFEDTSFCFVCSRCTDHWGEHDDLVDAGLVRYADNGNVYWTEKATDGALVAIRAQEMSWAG